MSNSALYEISQLLNTGLDRRTVSLLAELCDAGVNPEALAQVVKELTNEAKAIIAQAPTQGQSQQSHIGGTSSSSSTPSSFGR